MTWNHRVVRREYPKAAPSERVLYEIHEAFYNETGCYAITEEAIDPVGETVPELKERLQKMLAAIDKPVLDYQTRKEIA